MIRLPSITTIVTLMTLVSGCGGDDPVQPPPPGLPPIAFASKRTGLPQICLMNADGTGVHQISHSVQSARTPRWSPAGDRIAFVGGDSLEAEVQIFVCASDGSNQVDLTKVPGARNLDPSWSPDGSRIAFASTRDGNLEIYMMNADGSNPLRLTNTAEADFMPRWSPTGDAITFLSNRSGMYELYSMQPDGSNQVPLTSPPHQVSQYSWSKSHILVFSSSAQGNYDIYRIASDGTGEARLTSDTLNQTEPAWSPDGQRLAYFSSDGIHVMSADGSNDHWVPDSNYLGFGLAWSPDGSTIALANLANGDFDIVTTAAEGTGRQNLTHQPGDDLDPAWKP